MEFPLDTRPIDPSLEVDDSLPLVDRIVLCSTDKRKYLSHISLISEAVETVPLPDVDRLLQVIENCLYTNTVRDYELLKSVAIQLPAIFTRLLRLVPFTLSVPGKDDNDPTISRTDGTRTLNLPTVPLPSILSSSTTILERIQMSILRTFRYFFLEGGAHVQAITIDAFIATIGELMRTLIPSSSSSSSTPSPVYMAYPLLYHELCENFWSIVVACGSPDERYIIRTAAPTLAMTMHRAIYYDTLSTIGSKGIANFLLTYCQDPYDLELHKSVAVALRLFTNPLSNNILDTLLPSLHHPSFAPSSHPLFHRTLSNVLGSSLLTLPSPTTTSPSSTSVSSNASLSSPLEAEAQSLFYKVITTIIPPQPNEDNSPVNNDHFHENDDDDGSNNHNHVHKIHIQEAFARFALPLLVSTNPLYFVRYFVPLCINLVQESHPTVAVAAYPLIGQLLAILAPAADVCTMRLVGTSAYFTKDIFHHTRKSRLIASSIDDYVTAIFTDDLYKEYGDVALLNATFDALLQSYLALAAGNIPQFAADVTHSLNEKTHQQVQRINSVHKQMERKRNKSFTRKNRKVKETNRTNLSTTTVPGHPLLVTTTIEKKAKVPPPPPASPATESFPVLTVPRIVPSQTTDGTEKPMLSLSGLSFLDGDEEDAAVDDDGTRNDDDADNEDNGSSHSSILMQGRKYNKYGIRTLPSAVVTLTSNNSLDSTEDNTDIFSDSDDSEDNDNEDRNDDDNATDPFTLTVDGTALRPIALRKVLSSGRTFLHDTDDYSNSLTGPTLTAEDAVSNLLLDEEIDGLSPTVITDEDDEGYHSSTTNTSNDSNSDRLSTGLSIDIDDDDNENDYYDENNGTTNNVYSSDLIAAEVTSYQIGDLRVRRAEAVARTLPGVVRALCAMAMDILQVCHLTRMGVIMLDGSKYHVHRHRARALLVHRVRTIIRIIHRLYRTRDSVGHITSALCTGLHEIVASLLVACRAIAHLSAHIENHPVHNLGAGGLLSPSLIMESPGHRSTINRTATNYSNYSNSANAAATTVTGNSDDSTKNMAGKDNNMHAPGVPPPVESDTLTRLTEARVCDVAVAVLLKSLRRNEELIVEAAFIACGKVLPLLEEGRHVKLLDAMFKAARIPLNNPSEKRKGEETFSVPSSYSASAMDNTSPTSHTSPHSHTSSASSQNPRKPRWTVADNVGWRLRAALVHTFPSIIPVLSAQLLVSHIVPAVLRMVGDPIAEVRNLASDALAVALGALWHFSQRPLPLPELTVAHVKRVSLRLNSNILNSIGGSGSVTTENGNGNGTADTNTVTTSVMTTASSSQLLPSVDMATITLTANCLEDTIRQLTSLVESNNSSTDSNNTSSTIIPGSHNGRVAYATMCKAIFGIRDRHSIAVDGISTINPDNFTQDVPTINTEEDLSVDPPSSTSRTVSSTVSSVIPLLFDARTDPILYLHQPCHTLAPVACAFIHAQGYIPQSYLEELLGGSHRSINNNYEDSNTTANNVRLPLFWKNITHSIYQLYREYGTDIPTAGYPSSFNGSLPASSSSSAPSFGISSSTSSSSASSSSSSLNSLPPQVRQAVLLAQPHAPKLRNAEQLRKAAGFLYDKYLKLPLLRLLRYYRPNSYWWNEIGPLAGSVALAVAEREWRPILARETIDRHLTERIRKQRWEEEEELRKMQNLPSKPVIQKHIRLRAWSGNVHVTSGSSSNSSSSTTNNSSSHDNPQPIKENGSAETFLSMNLADLRIRNDDDNDTDGKGDDNGIGITMIDSLNLDNVNDDVESLTVARITVGTETITTTNTAPTTAANIEVTTGFGRSNSKNNLRSWNIEAPITEVGNREKGGGGFR